MNVDILTKASFSVIGKEGSGLASDGMQWVPPLWREAEAHFDEIAQLAKYDDQGRILGLWGAMTDPGHAFKPWASHGKYLAGVEVEHGAEAPVGWCQWTIPAFRFVVAPCSKADYASVFHAVLDEYFPAHGHVLAGAVQECYADGGGDTLALYFPIERL
ncbi:GyrI-like domain-containing protein [Chitiniphilus eburneus]|uniref:GyrI-like domain-containing protein n=1 Tax=Chitiniphilus eburneus TaxID=2571148 RepID=A0A4U0PKH2_9NEIS|nr:GyrI-like domain-containing protein [Chitiniphilus eburneus]TJZ68596.1 GyrI-like domain-containing protein [Chitiniphilus eburneus]